MPWHVRKDGGRWAIVKSDTGEVVGHSDTHEKAMASVRARYASMEGSEMGQRMMRRRGRAHMPALWLLVASCFVALTFWFATIKAEADCSIARDVKRIADALDKQAQRSLLLPDCDPALTSCIAAK